MTDGRAQQGSALDMGIPLSEAEPQLTGRTMSIFRGVTTPMHSGLDVLASLVHRLCLWRGSEVGSRVTVRFARAVHGRCSNSHSIVLW